MPCRDEGRLSGVGVSMWTSVLVHQRDDLSWRGGENLGEEDEDMPQMRGLPICIAQTIGTLPDEPQFPIHQILCLTRSEEITATCSYLESK